VTVSDTLEPADLGHDSQVFISGTYDATSHFETTCTDVLNIFSRGQGHQFDFSKIKHLSLDGSDE
jgi:Rab GDP dissociation inhibitor